MNDAIAIALTDSTPVTRSSQLPRRGREAAERDAEDHGPADPEHGERRGVGEGEPHHPRHWLLRPAVSPEVAVEGAGDEPPELDGDGPVEAHADASRISAVARGPRATLAGSPGTTWTMLKSRVIATRTIRNASPRRRSA
jgi:hypothetical protein